MTLGTRALNRLTLLALAASAIIVAVTAAWPVVNGGAPLPLLAPVEAAMRSSVIAPAGWAWIAAGVLAVLAAIALVIVFTRPVRHERAAVDDDGIAIDDDVIADLLRDALADVPDILSVTAVTQRRRTQRIVRTRIQVRPRADLALLQRRIAAAVGDTDRRLGLPVPLVVQLTGGLRSTFAHERRVA